MIRWEEENPTAWLDPWFSWAPIGAHTVQYAQRYALYEEIDNVAVAEGLRTNLVQYCVFVK